MSSAAVLAIVTVLPFSPLAEPLGLGWLNAGTFAALVAVVVAYVIVTESLKRHTGFLFNADRPHSAHG